MSKNPILYDIKIGTGIAIIFVVIGHLASRGQEGIDLYVNLKSLIYKFHMPLFLFFSGYISGYTYKKIKTFQQYIFFIRKKFLRLFPAYLLLSIMFFLGKYILGSTTSLLNGLVNVFISPSSGNSGFLWYIYVLFLYNLILPLIIFTTKNYFSFFFLLTIILSFFSFTNFLNLNFFFWYLPFFMVGCFVSEHRERYTFILKKTGPSSLILFIIWGVSEYLKIVDIPKIVVGFLSIGSLHYGCLFLIKRNKLFEFLGDSSFYIYLFNTMFTGGISILLIKYFGKQSFYSMFYFLVPILVIMGLYLPIILQKYIISKVPILKNWIR